MKGYDVALGNDLAPFEVLGVSILIFHESLEEVLEFLTGLFHSSVECKHPPTTGRTLCGDAAMKGYDVMKPVRNSRTSSIHCRVAT
jgi:hypothetical protein